MSKAKAKLMHGQTADEVAQEILNNLEEVCCYEVAVEQNTMARQHNLEAPSPKMQEKLRAAQHAIRADYTGEKVESFWFESAKVSADA